MTEKLQEPVLAQKPEIAAESRAVNLAFSEEGKAATSLPVEFLFALHGWPNPTPPQIPGGPFGHRFLHYVDHGYFEGPHLRGKVINPSGDWATLGPDGVKRLDVRLTLQTEDDVIILMEYKGFIDGLQIHVSGTFQVNHERYNWLNKVLYVGVAQRQPDKSLVYMFYTLN
jgi:hypothetical protein